MGTSVLEEVARQVHRERLDEANRRHEFGQGFAFPGRANGPTAYGSAPARSVRPGAARLGAGQFGVVWRFSVFPAGAR